MLTALSRCAVIPPSKNVALKRRLEETPSRCPFRLTAFIDGHRLQPGASRRVLLDAAHLRAASSLFCSPDRRRRTTGSFMAAYRPFAQASVLALLMAGSLGAAAFAQTPSAVANPELWPKAAS
ncbi:MAG TPA: hypothetical protein PLH31_16610, partial [Caulobacter sp.]|nr:hypothetical protein [Caulobacter sp.]